MAEKEITHDFNEGFARETTEPESLIVYGANLTAPEATTVVVSGAFDMRANAAVPAIGYSVVSTNIDGAVDMRAYANVPAINYSTPTPPNRRTGVDYGITRDFMQGFFDEEPIAYERSTNDAGRGVEPDTEYITAAVSDTDLGTGDDTQSVHRITAALEDIGVANDDIASVGTSLTSSDSARGRDKQAGEGSYQLIVASDSPNGYWRLGEDAGTIAYDFMGNYDGTYVGTPTLGATGALYDSPDTAVNFDAEGDYFTVDNPKSVPGRGSIEAWVHTETWEDTGRHGVFQNVPAWGNAANYISLFRSAGSTTENGLLYLRIIAPDGSIQDISPEWSSVLKKNTWNHVVATWDDTHMRLYINGEQRDSRTYTPPTAFPSNEVRWAMGNQYTLRGRGDEFALYDVALTPEQILEHYQAAIHMLTDGDVGGADENVSSGDIGTNNFSEDSARGIEGASQLTSDLLDSESVAGDDFAGAYYPVEHSDSGGLTEESQTMGAAVNDFDTASHSELQSTTAGGAATDSAVGIESQSLLVSISQGDSGFSTESNFKVEEFFSTDVATAYEDEVRAILATIKPVSIQITQQRYDYFILEERPVGYWRLGDADGSTIAEDSSGNGYHADRPATATTVPGALVGDSDLGVRDADATVASGLPETVDSFTIEFWIRYDAAADMVGNYESFVYRVGGNGVRWQVQRSAMEDSLYMRLDTSGGVNQTGGTLAALDGKWHHVVYVVDRGIRRAFLDGALVSEGGYVHGDGFDTAGAPLYIVRSEEARDEVSFYDRALTAAEIKRHYDVGAFTRYGFLAVEPNSVLGVSEQYADAYAFDWAATPA